jgi:hypothetical protein
MSAPVSICKRVVQDIIGSHGGEHGGCLRFGKSDMPGEQDGEHNKIDHNTAAADEAEHQEPNREQTAGCLRDE